jgi:hypothetical protein
MISVRREPEGPGRFKKQVNQICEDWLPAKGWRFWRDGDFTNDVGFGFYVPRDLLLPYKLIF